MTRPPRPIPVGTFKATERMRALIASVLDSGRISYGPFSMAFERGVAKEHDCAYGVLSNSGTSSLHVALQALKELDGWADGDEVLVPASTFVATVNVVLHNNLRPVFVDIETLTYGMDALLANQAVTPRTRAMIPAHLYGQPCAMMSDGQSLGLMDVATAHDLAVVEDSCECMFATCQGRSVGSMGDVGCFSTYNAHLITTGVGGMAVTNDPRLASKIRSLVNHGLDIAELNADEWFSPRPATGRSFRFTHAGHSFRITELEAAIGLAQLETKDDMLRVRRRNAAHLGARLRQVNDYADAGMTLPQVATGHTHSWMMYPVVLDPARTSKATMLAYLNAAGIETRDMMPITTQPIYAGMLDPDAFPVSKWTNENGFYVGCHQDLTPDDIDYVGDVISEWFHA